jgi:thiol-disulfide isomerase/thioredoxin
MPKWLSIEVRAVDEEDGAGSPRPEETVGDAAAAGGDAAPGVGGAGESQGRRINVGALAIALVAVILIGAGAWVARNRITSAPSVVATVNGEDITAADVDRELAIQKALHEMQGQSLTTNPDDLTAFRRDILDQLVDQVLMLAAARGAGFTVSTQDALAAMGQKGVDPAALEAGVRADGISAPEIEAWAVRQEILSRFLVSDQAISIANGELQRQGKPPYQGGLNPSDLAAALQHDADIEFHFEGFEGGEGAGVSVAREGEPAPDFTLQGLDGRPVRLSDFAGRPVVVNFWATWCGPCKIEIPLLVRTYEAHQADGLVLLAVDVQEDADTVRPFVDQYKMSFPVVLDNSGQVATLYRVRALPTSIFVAADGELRKAYRGAIVDGGQLDELLGTILPAADGGAAVPPAASAGALTLLGAAPRLSVW